MAEVIIVSNARSYHVMDWYRTVREICNGDDIFFATDLVCSEGFLQLVQETDLIIPLFIIDRLLFHHQSSWGHVWRNLIKLLVSPFQVLKLRHLSKKHPDALFHAHSMYYVFLCFWAGLKYVATPMGSDILVRPKKSKLYKYFAKKSLMAAQQITVDSFELKKAIQEMCGKEALVIQNGVDVKEIQKLTHLDRAAQRSRIVSIRAMDPLYRIDQILEARARSEKYAEEPLDFLYPFYEAGYKAQQLAKFHRGDHDLGRLPKDKLYELLDSTLLALSVPVSDSSPRTVYEAIFSGCCVAVSYGPWIELLPSCMRARVTVVDLKDDQWFTKAVDFAKQVAHMPYVPSQQALDIYDQRTAMTRVSKLLYQESRA